VQAPDDQHVVLTIDAPKAYFLAKLTYPTAFVVDRQQVAAGGDAWQSQPNGTGPFRLAEYIPEEQLVLARHAGYYRQPAYLDEVEFDLRPADAMSRYENRELDATPVGVSDLERVSDPLNPLSYELLRGPASLDVQYIAFNNRVPPFDDPHVRRALNLALDKERLARVVLQGGVVPAEGILPPGLPGTVIGSGPLHFDEAAARRELAASRYGGPEQLPPLTLYGSGEGGANPMLSAVADYLHQTLGVSVTVEQAPYDTFQEELQEGRYGMYALGWAADYPDPQDFLDLLFHSQSLLNQTGYANPAVDRLLEEARVETDAAKRLALYSQAHQLILADAPWVPLYHGSDRWLVAPEVQGFSVPPIVLPRLARVWLNPAGS
jgi:ABC-type oligopeptide transport system substrate-binding subunit